MSILRISANFVTPNTRELRLYACYGARRPEICTPKMAHFSSGRCQKSKKMKLTGTLENRRKATNCRIKKSCTALKNGLCGIKKYLISTSIQQKNAYRGVGVHFKKMRKSITTRECSLLNKKNKLPNHSFSVVISRKLKIGN